MYISIHIDSIGSIIGSFLLFITIAYSLILFMVQKSDINFLDYLGIQISFFIYLLGNAVYITAKDPAVVLFWTRVCYFGAISIIATGWRFSETFRGIKHAGLCRFFVAVSMVCSLLIFLPGDHFFTNILNPQKTHSSVIKGDFFSYLIIGALLIGAIAFFKLTVYVLKTPHQRKRSIPIIIGLAIFTLSTIYDGIFAAVLSLTKGQLWIGPTAMSLCLAYYSARLSKERVDEVERLYNDMIHDKLSGVFTRDYLMESLTQSIAQKTRLNRVFSLLFIDMDNFKRLNDELGHKMGDEILALFGQTLIKKTRKCDIPARFGGDEFLILLGDCRESCAERVAENIQDQFRRVLHKKLDSWKGVDSISLSIGIVNSEDWDEKPKAIIHRADLAMYASKKKGKNKITLYSADLWKESVTKEK